MILECVVFNTVEVLGVMREEIVYSKLYKLSLYEIRLLQNM